MVINYTEIKSAITPINEDHVQEFLSGIEKAGGFSFQKIGMEAYPDADFCLIFVLTGGTEGIFLKNLDLFKTKPCYLLTSGESNSLAASMEILSYLKSHGYKGEILHGDANHIAERIMNLFRKDRTMKKLCGAKVGSIGGSSDWLIDSDPDEAAYREKLGIEIVHISMSEFLEEIRKGGYEENQTWRYERFRRRVFLGNPLYSGHCRSASRKIRRLCRPLRLGVSPMFCLCGID